MKLNTKIWNGNIPVRFYNGGTKLGWKCTKEIHRLQIPLNVGLYDQSICYAVDMKPMIDKIFCKVGQKVTSQSAMDVTIVKNKNPVARHLIVSNNTADSNNKTSAGGVNYLGGSPIIFSNQYKQRYSYGATDIDTKKLNWCALTEFKFIDFVMLVMIAYKTITTDSDNNVKWSRDVTSVTLDEYFAHNDTWFITHPIVTIYVLPYISNGSKRYAHSLGFLDIAELVEYSKPPYDGYNDNFFIPFTDFNSEYNVCNPATMFGFCCAQNSYTGPVPVWANLGKSELWKFSYHTLQDSSNEWGIATKFIGTKNDIIKFYSRFGFYYTGDRLTAETGSLTSDKMYIGKIDDEGKLTGEALNGEDTDKTIQSTWNNGADWQNNNFNGIENTDPNNYTDKIDLNKPTLSNVNVFNRSFAVNSNNVRQLADFLWNADETKFNEIVKGLALMGENPMNGIIDLRLFPFNVALKNSATQAEPIVIGRTNTGINGIKLTENVNSLIDLGECTFFTKFKNFLDYEPYTTAQLYIPYIGVVPVSTAEFMGHKISVKMIVDYTTGAGTAIVFKDDIPFIYRNGVVGVSIPMTGTDSSTYANTVIGNVVSGVSQIATAGIGSSANFEMANINSQISSNSSSASAYRSAVGASGQRAGAVASGTGGIMGGLGNIYNGFTTPVQYQSAGASSPSVATWQPQKCYFIIDRPILNVPDNYGRTVGYACEVTGKLSDFKGFTVVSNPEISFKCTETEKTMLSQLLNSGVFI